jgi:hypothetical protein
VLSADQVLTARALKQTPVWEAAFIRAFVRTYGSNYIGFDINVRVGPGAPVNPDLHPSWQYAQSQVTRLRIDLVAWRPDGRVDLFEVKRAPDKSTVEQILNYGQLWLNDGGAAINQLGLLTPPFRPSLLAHLMTAGVASYVFDLSAQINPDDVPADA